MTLPNITEWDDLKLNGAFIRIIKPYTVWFDCTKIVDLWPLMVELRIIHVPYKDNLWEVYCYEYSDCIEPRYPNSEGLLRALAEIVYLVLQAKANDI